MSVLLNRPVSRNLDMSSIVDTDMDKLTRLREATEARANAEKEWREAVRDAMQERSGYTVADVEAAAGVSRARVYQIVEGK